MLASTLALAATATLLLVAMAGASALGQSATDSPPAPSSSADPTLTPVESRDAYRDQSDVEALATVRDQFDGLLDTPPLKWPAVQPGEDIHGYLTDNSAVVSEPDGGRGVIESTLPLRGETPAGHEAAIDLGLVDVSDAASAPRSTAAPVRIPDDSTGELRFPDQSFGISVADANPQQAQVESNNAFYANVKSDSDLVLAPRPDGAELSIVLRSADAPTSIPLRFSLADGQRLAQTDATDGTGLPPGSVQMVDDSESLATVYPAIAVDAVGNGVPVSYELDGDDVTMKVDAPADTTYPVLVDPIVGVYDNNGTSVCPSAGCGSSKPAGFVWPGWRPGTNTDPAGTALPTSWSYCNNQGSHPDRKFYFCQGSLSGAATDGGALFIKSNPFSSSNVSYGTGEWGQWVKEPPPYAYIYKLDAAALTNVVPGQAALAVGVRKADGSDWECGSVQWGDGTRSVGAALTPSGCSNTTNLPAAYKTGTSTALSAATRYVYVHTLYQGDATPSPAIAPGDRAVLRMVMTGGAASTNPLPYVQMGGAATYESETYGPTVDSVTHTKSPPSGWVDSYSDTSMASAWDKGLGMGTVTATGPGISNSTATKQTSTGTYCTSGTPPSGSTVGATNLYDGCQTAQDKPLTLSTTYTAPQGINNYAISATDLVGNQTPSTASPQQSWTVKVDRGGPTVTTSGLTDNQVVSNDVNLSVHAVDGDTGSLASQRSGVKTIDVTTRTASGAVVDSSPDPSPQSCSSSCPKDRSVPLKTGGYSSGSYVAEVVATDQVGNPSSRTTISFVVTHPPVSTAPPSLSGAATDGSTLSASTGTWTGTAPLTYQYKWQSCSGSSTSCVDLPGETEPTLALTSEDVTRTVRVVVTASNRDGSASAVSQASVPISPLAPTNSSEPGLLGDPYVDSPMEVDAGTWQGSFPFSYQYQWYRCALGGLCSAILGATTADYVPTTDDIAQTLRADVTATNAAGMATMTSVESDPIEPAASTPAPDGGPDQADPPTSSEQLDREQRFRADSGLPADTTTVQGLIANSDLGFSRENYGGSLTPIEERTLEAGASVEETTDAIDDYGTTQAAADYAGIYVDHVNGAPVVNVGFTQNAAQHLADIRAFSPQPSRVHTFSATRSLAALTDTQTRVENDWDTLEASGMALTSVSVEVQANEVQVGVSNPSTAIASSLNARYGAGVTMVAEQPAVDAAASGPHTRTSRTRPMRAGLAIYPHDHSTVCTAGYLTRDEIPHPVTGTDTIYGMMTAGHCFADQDTHFGDCGQQWRQGGRSIGCQYGDNTYKNGMRSDAGMILLNTGKDSSNLLYISNRFSRNVRSVYHHDEKGYTVCLSGYKSGVGCGHIAHSGTYTISSSHGKRRLKSMVRVSGFECAPGDSGAPIYHFQGAEGAQAVGIVSGFVPRYAGAHFGPCIYSQVRHIQQELSVTVRTHR